MHRFFLDRLAELTESEAGDVFERILTSLLEIKPTKVSNLRSDLATFVTELNSGTESDKILWACILASRFDLLRARFRVVQHASPKLGALTAATRSRIDNCEEWASLEQLRPTERRLILGTILF